MANVNGLLSDPDFQRLSPTAQRDTLSQLAPHLAGITDDDFQSMKRNAAQAGSNSQQLNAQLGIGLPPATVTTNRPAVATARDALLKSIPATSAGADAAVNAFGSPTRQPATASQQLANVVKTMAAPVTGIASAPGQLKDFITNGFRNKPMQPMGAMSGNPVTDWPGYVASALTAEPAVGAAKSAASATANAAPAIGGGIRGAVSAIPASLAKASIPALAAGEVGGPKLAAVVGGLTSAPAIIKAGIKGYQDIANPPAPELPPFVPAPAGKGFGVPKYPGPPRNAGSTPLSTSTSTAPTIRPSARGSNPNDFVSSTADAPKVDAGEVRTATTAAPTTTGSTLAHQPATTKDALPGPTASPKTTATLSGAPAPKTGSNLGTNTRQRANYRATYGTNDTPAAKAARDAASAQLAALLSGGDQ